MVEEGRYTGAFATDCDGGGLGSYKENGGDAAEETLVGNGAC
jgi:hypothetical protein